MDSNQFVAIVAQAAMRQGVSTERLGLSINAATGKYARTALFPAKLVDGPPAGTVELGSREPTGLVATLTHCAEDQADAVLRAGWPGYVQGLLVVDFRRDAQRPTASRTWAKLNTPDAKGWQPRVPVSSVIDRSAPCVQNTQRASNIPIAWRQSNVQVRLYNR